MFSLWLWLCQNLIESQHGENVYQTLQQVTLKVNNGLEDISYCSVLYQLSRPLTRSQELTSSCPDCSPQVGRQLLWVLMLQDELGDGSLPQRSARSHRPHTALLLHQLTVHQGHQLPLHGPTKDAGTEGRYTCSRSQGPLSWTVHLGRFSSVSFTIIS